MSITDNASILRLHHYSSLLAGLILAMRYHWPATRVGTSSHGCESHEHVLSRCYCSSADLGLNCLIRRATILPCSNFIYTMLRALHGHQHPIPFLTLPAHVQLVDQFLPMNSAGSSYSKEPGSPNMTSQATSDFLCLSSSYFKAVYVTVAPAP